MPTDKQRITISMEPELMASLNGYMDDNNRRNTSAAIRELLEKGLAVINGQDASCAPSTNAMQLAAAYDRLDIFGQIALKETADREQKRMEAQQAPIRRPLAARNGTQLVDLSTLQPISVSEVKQGNLDI